MRGVAPTSVVFFQLVLCLATACGRVGYQAVGVGPDATLPDDRSPPDPGSPPDAPVADADDGGTAEGARADVADETSDGAQREDPGTDGANPPDVGDVAEETAVPPSLLLRYDFVGTGTVVVDRAGSADGQVLGGARLDGSGGLTLDGIDDYVDLPNGLVSGLSSVTVVAWLQWAGGGCWQRVFDFGSSTGGEGNVGNATTSLSLTPEGCPAPYVTGLFEFESTLRAATSTTVAGRTPTQLALAVDGARSTMTVYVNGAQVAQVTLTNPLSRLRDVNNWLGRSQWVQDNHLRGRLDELRIYRKALSQSELAALHAGGPDTL